MADGAASGYRGENRIDALHEDLLGEIITRLPATDAANTASIARDWRHLWRSTPLVLRDCKLPEARRAAIVARVLDEHPGPFRTISLISSSFASLDLELADWPRLLATKRTQKLALINMPTGAQPIVSRVPTDILRCGSLQELSLAFLTLPEDLPRVAVDGFPNLRELCLVRTATSYQDLEYLLAASPVLQTLMFICDLTPTRVHVRSRSIRCVLAGLSGVEEFTVVDAPLLERLFLFQPPWGGADCVRVKIACSLNLGMLGYLDPRIHRLQIGDNIIQSDTIVSPSTVVPGVRILALKVNFGVLSEVKMLASFLRCFPNVDTLHIQSVLHDPSANESSWENNAKFWQHVSPVKCLRSHVKSMVIHKFRGDQNEFEFVKFLAMNAQELQSLVVVRPDVNFALVDKVNEIIDKLGCPRFRAWTSKVLLVSPKVYTIWGMNKVNDLTTVDDPFCV
uniref:Uncharacterized protein n=6 Tax=Avena sativa TaxID=4498 RepID=A0ACD5UGR4_AVESA